MAKKKIGQRKMRPSSTDDPDELSFEQTLEKLEEVVRQLEDGQLGLDQSLIEYERGVKYLKQCYEQLQRAERKIELLANVDAEGRVRSKPFADADLSLEEKQAARSQRRSRGSGPGGGDLEMDDRASLF